MIDLSFLTEEEQEAIMKVLQRDAALKRAEEERVRHLPEKIKDDQQLKNMSGQWFYEAKAKRHRDKIHGTDIIRASMRKKRLQVAAEQSKDRENEAKESWVNNVNKDTFLPPELAGVVEEQEEDVGTASPSLVNPASTVIDTSQENSRKSAMSPATKQRKNPFNSSKLPEDHLSQQTENEQSKNGRAGFFQTSKEGELSELKEKSSNLDISSLKSEKLKQTFTGPESGSQIKAPIPKARKMIYTSHVLKQDDNQPLPRQRTDSLNARGAPRGILKRNSSSSSTDSETVRFHQNFDSKSKVVSPGLTIHERISEKDHSLEDDTSSNSLEPLKHVRFSAVKDELPSSPGLIRGREVGEFSVLEFDRLKNGTQEVRDMGEFWKDPKPLQYRKPLPLHQSASSPSAANNEAHQPTASGSFPINGHSSPSEVLTARPQPIENSPTVNEHKAKSSELSRLESELSKSPAEKHFYVADELSRVEPEPTQVPDHSSRDHQQGKPPLLKALKAKTSSRSDPYATEIRKTTDDSISKVLDWFNRSSHSDDNKSPLEYPQRIEPKEETDSKSQTAIALVTDDTSLKENGSKALLSTKVELTPMGFDSTFQVEKNMLPSRNCQDNAKIKPKSVNLSQQDKEGPGILQPFQTYSSNQKSRTTDYSQASKNIGEGNGVPPPTSDYSYSALKGSDAADQVPCNIKEVSSLCEEELKLHVYEKNRGKSEANFDSSKIVKETNLKDNMKTERESKASLEPEIIELLSRAANNKSPWKKPEVQLQETSEVPKNQVQREKYKRVSDRISFWEGEKAAAKLTHKEPRSSLSQGQPSAKAYQPAKSMDSSSVARNEYNQGTGKQVVLDEDGQAACLSSFYSSDKPKEIRAPKLGPSESYPSIDQSGKVSLFRNKINEPVKRLPVADSLHSGGDITLPALQHPSNVRTEIHTSLEKDRSVIGESHSNFKVLSLKERLEEPNAEWVSNHSQFENLRKFWDLGANPKSQDNVEKNTMTISQKNSVHFNSQKHKELRDIKSSGKNIHETEMFLSQKKVPATEEIGKLNSKSTLQVLPDETAFPVRPPRKSTHRLPGNESSEENVEKNTKQFVTPVFKEEKNYSDQEIQESIVKTSVLPKDYKDTFSDSLQKPLSEASSPAIQPSGGKVHGKQVLEPDVSENRTWLQKTGFADAEEAAKEPKEIINECVDKTVAPPKVKLNTLAASLDKLLKEGTGTLPSPLQTKLEPVTTRINSEPEERVFEKEIEWSRNSSAHQREIITPFPEGEETLGKMALPQEAESGECQLNTESLFQMAAEGSQPLEQPSRLHRKGSFGDVANSPHNMPSSRDAHLAAQEKALSSQREISETVEKVILPPKPALNDVNVVLQKLLREALLSYPVDREVVIGEVKAEFPEGVQAAGSPPNSLAVTPPLATMDIIVPDRRDLYSFNTVSDKTYEVGSYLAAQRSPSEQSLSSSGSTVTQYGKVLPQEVAEIVRETIIQPKSELLEFSAGLEKLLKETMETPSLKYESDTGTLSPPKLIGSTQVPRQAASEFHLEELKETVKKSEAPSIAESAFDTGFEKLLKETSEAPSYQLQVSVKEETPEKETSQSEQARFLGRTQETPEMKLKSNVLKSQVNQYDKVLGGEAVTDFSVGLCGSESGIEVPGTPQLYVDREIGTTESINPLEHRNSESEFAGVLEGAFQAPGFEERPGAISVSRNRKAIPGLTNKGNPTKTSKSELILASPCKRQEKEEEKEGVSDSDFSDGNTGSNAESWRNTSSSEEEPSPVLKTLERSAARKMPSKSLEDISSDSSNQAKVDNLPEELVRSAEDEEWDQVGGFAMPKWVCSYSAVAETKESDDRETDTTSESSYQLSRHKKSPSSLTNLSSSSGMTSLSSVSGSVMSIYSGDFGNLEIKGNIQFAIDYVDSLKELHIFVAQCKDLAAADVKKQRSDPYVKTYLLPDKGKMGKKKTLVVKKTLNPVYNEILRTAPVALEAENRGEMKLALQYVPEPLPGKTTDPVFNHTMVYDGFRPEDLTEACVELTVWDHYKLTNQLLGGLRIGFGTGKSYGTEVDWMDSTSEEVALWEKMVKSPNTWIEATLPLRMLLIAKISK
ncbi:Synaptotagmin-like protein 2 [Pteropus alecto]|uniref:Synaptotagmin-like protein 2 n=1 Tax=Pteropus alecto TaxID=9402 RepID=L5JNC7_PTEAL|nr:Synaptotagmin-like protein 2 [Pteropus alecto]